MCINSLPLDCFFLFKNVNLQSGVFLICTHVVHWGHLCLTLQVVVGFIVTITVHAHIFVSKTSINQNNEQVKKASKKAESCCTTNGGKHADTWKM